MLLTWAPQVLRNAGLSVVETGGWTNRSHGSYPDSISGVWHHDASPPGDSPGALNWMISNWDSASANFWVNRQGVWYCVGAGVSWHAGVVVAGMPGSFLSFGVETDQTINEQPTEALLESTRRGFAALLKHMGRNSQSLYFHKTIAPLRKQDPWLGPSSDNRGNWPNELIIERSNVRRIMDGGTPTPPTSGDELTVADIDKLTAAQNETNRLLNASIEQQSAANQRLQAIVDSLEGLVEQQAATNERLDEMDK